MSEGGAIRHPGGDNQLPHPTSCYCWSLFRDGRESGHTSIRSNKQDRNHMETLFLPPRLTRKLTKLAPKLIRGLWFLKETESDTSAAVAVTNQQKKKTHQPLTGVIKVDQTCFVHTEVIDGEGIHE